MPLIQRKGAQSSQGFGEFTQGAGVNPNQFIENLFSTYLYSGEGTPEIFGNGVALSSNASPWSTNTLTFSGLNIGVSVTSDSNGNYYVCGYYGSPYKGFLAKYNSLNVLQWQKVFSSGINYVNKIAVDSSGNVYVVGSNAASISLIKYNSSGTIQWQRNLSDSSASGYYRNSLYIDNSGNIYISGCLSSANAYVALAKYDSSGTLQWQRKVTVSGLAFQDLTGVATDSSNNVYLICSTNNSPIKNYILKYNSAGTLQWQRMLSATQVSGASIAIDGSNNVCVTGYYLNSGTYSFVAQYNSSGVLQWQRSLRVSTFNDNNSTSISVDSSNNIYIGGYVGTNPNNGFAAKYNSSGTIQWQRQFSANNIFGGFINGINVDGNNNVYVTGYIPATYNFVFVTKFAQDGTSTSGTAIMNMASSNLFTDAAGAMTDAAGTATDAAGTATDAAGSAVDTAGSATTNFATQSAIVSNGGMVWIKSRNKSYQHAIFDTSRGPLHYLDSSSTAADTTGANDTLTSFTSSGFSLGYDTNSIVNGSSLSPTYTSWSFKKQAKFFDVVTWTGNGVAGRAISHNLNSTPGFIIVKRTDTTSNWPCWHQSLNGGAGVINLNTTAAWSNDSSGTYWGNGSSYVAPTSTTFTVSSNAALNASGGTYVAYLYASNAGGFGADGTQNVITCGSFVSSATDTITLGYEPQFILLRDINSGNSWFMLDVMRGMSLSGGNILYSNTNASETILASNKLYPTATGFVHNGLFPASETILYIAIRRGPMATPTVGTSVFSPIAVSSSVSYNTAETTNFVIDTQLATARGGYTNNSAASSRLTGVSTTSGNAGTSTLYLVTSGTAAESTTSVLTNGWNNTGFYIPASLDITSSIYWSFRRSPGFFDEVCYTGTGANTTQTHNLGVIPELMIIKERSASNDWQVYSSSLGNTQYLVLNTTAAAATGATRWNSTTPTSSVFSIGTDTTVNASTQTYVAYLFATCLGVSKVGSYTGTGATQTVNCGFTGGARFVMIKRTDSTGDWYVWDTARGMVAGTDPYLLFNTTAAEVNANNVYTATTGFQIVGTGAGINASGGSYIFLAIS
jgi:Beta-propeller repeat